MRAAILILSIVLAVSIGTPGYGQPSYYAGKTIELLVLSAVGGATIFSIGLSRRFSRRIFQAEPPVRIRNMPGDGTIFGMNWFAANAKPDGMTVLASTVASKVAYMLENPVVRYDFRKMKLVAINGSGAVF